jgi:DNA-binding transcriptional ArsR family regulator
MESSTAGNKADDLDLLFSALADRNRRAILERLRSGPATVGELAAPLPLGMPAISKHLTVLERAGLVRRRAEAQRRRCSLDEEGFRRLEKWMTHYSDLWSGSLDRLAGLLGEEDGR